MIDDAPKLTPGDHHRTLAVGGRERDYLVHVPQTYDGSNPAPVVLAFHGGLSNATQMVDFCGLNDKAEQAGFLVAYPNGTGRVPGAYTWNGGNCCGYAQVNGIDDVAFVRELLDDLSRVAHVDVRRIYATGMSNGAILAYRLADELSDRIAAIAPVGAPMGSETCRPKRPVSVVHFHGTDDRFAPFTGGRGERSLSQVEFFPVQRSIDNWVRANDCPREPVVTSLDPKVNDGTTVTRNVYGPGRNEVEVVLYRIEDAGHTWPGREPPIAFLGKSTQNLSANDVMWEFFEKHARK